MAKIYYYMALFPTEALIASMLAPEQFGSYMATGYKSGSHEQLIFAEIEGEFGTEFDWDYAKEKTVPHEDGKPKYSVYLSIYRVLERVPLSKMKKLYLTTSDGRTLGLEKSEFPKFEGKKPYYLYQDLCPVNPLVISAFEPKAFGEYMVNKNVKISLPALFFCDMKVVDMNNLEHSGHIGPIYDRNLGHLNECIKSVTVRGKETKMIERTFAGKFTFQIVDQGFALFNADEKVWYQMPTKEEFETKYYYWASSAMII